MTARDYYNFFESQPSDKWTTGTMTDSEGNYCAVGWIRYILRAYRFESKLKQLFSKWGYESPETINDDCNNKRGFGDSPRERILTVLGQIIVFEELKDEKVTASYPGADLVLA